MEPLPTPVSKAFLPSKLVVDVTISCKLSKQTPVRLLLYSQLLPAFTFEVQKRKGSVTTRLSKYRDYMIIYGHTILVHGRLAKNLLRILDKLLTELLGQLVLGSH
jgi:hypothetical protein